MNRFLLNTLLLVSIAAVGFIGWAAWEWGNVGAESRPAVAAITPLLDKANSALDSTTETMNQLSLAVGILNRDCNTKDPQRGLLPCGTLADVAKTLNTIRKTFGQVEVAAKHENQNLTTLDQQEAQLFEALHTSLQNFIALEVTLNDTVGNIQPLEDKLGLVLDATHRTTQHIDELITDQQLIELIQHANGIAGHLDGLSGDVETKTHELLYPEPCHGKVCWVKRSYQIIRGVIKLGEPVYYFDKVLTVAN